MGKAAQCLCADGMECLQGASSHPDVVEHRSRVQSQMLTQCCNGHCSNKTGAVLVSLCPETVCFCCGTVTIKAKPLYLTNIELNWTHFLLETSNTWVQPVAQLPLLPDGASQNCSWVLCSYPALLPLACYIAVGAIHCQSEGQFSCMSDLPPSLLQKLSAISVSWLVLQ